MSALSRDLYRSFAEITKAGHRGKAYLYGFTAIALGMLLNFGPLGVGVYLLFQGEIWKAIWVPIGLYVVIGLYMGLWPVLFFVWWYNTSFFDAFISTSVLLLLFAAPDFLMYRAMRAMQKSEEAVHSLAALDEKDSKSKSAMGPVNRSFRKEELLVLRDFPKLGDELVAILISSLKSNSTNALRELAKECWPSVRAGYIEREILLLHKFLVVKACADASPQGMSDRICSAFYEAWNKHSLRDVVQHSGEDTWEVKRAQWERRAQQYEVAFDSDWQQFLAKPPGHLPWKRVLTVFASSFGVDDPFVKAESVNACISVGVTFTAIQEKVTEAIQSHLEPS